MSFHKRWITKENLIMTYKNGGIDSVKRYYSADALMISDELCSKVLELLSENREDEVVQLLDNETL